MTLFLLISLIILIVAVACLYRHFHNSNKRSDKWFGIALAVTLPMLTLLGYLTIGSPKAIRLAAEGNLSNPAAGSIAGQGSNQPTSQLPPQLSPEQIQNAITALETETRDNPRDINKLVMLANSYAISQRFNDSANTWDKIVQLDGSAETLLRAADAHTFANQGAVNAKAQGLIDRALQLVPQHPQGLWMAGMSAVQKGKLEQGKEFWQRLYPMLTSQPEQQKELATLINQLDTELGKSSNQATNPASKQTVKPTVSSTVNSTTESTKAATATQAKISINVSLDPKVADQTNPSDTVFVFARAVQGPPAPLAVKRLKVSDLPTTIELTEQDAMIPQMTIATFPKIKISAKVSKSGNPSNREGDINSESIELSSLDNIGEQSLVIGR